MLSHAIMIVAKGDTMKYKWTTAISLASLSAILIVGAASDVVNSSQKQTSKETVKTARVVANGDILIHNTKN